MEQGSGLLKGGGDKYGYIAIVNMYFVHVHEDIRVFYRFWKLQGINLLRHI